MSADSYGKCPQCYNNINNESTLREDYEIGFDGNIFKVWYKGQCDCGYLFEYRHQEDVAVKEEEKEG